MARTDPRNSSRLWSDPGLGGTMPPHAYLTQHRVRRAGELLRAGIPAAEAAAGVGFYDQSALTRHFKRVYGVTPAQYAVAVAG